MTDVACRDVQSLIDRVCELLSKHADRERIRAARRRHAAAFKMDGTEYLPILFGAAVEAARDLPEFDWREQWRDPAKSLYMQLKGCVGSLAARADNCPSVRSDTGVINCMSVFGAGYTVPTHTKPVVTEYVSKDALREFELPEDISGLGVMPRVREHMEHHKGMLAAHGLTDVLSLTHCDQQGTWDVAAQTRGHDIFTDVYEDPDFVHMLMDKATDVYIAVTKLCKSISGDPLGSGNACGFWMENGGVRMCGDSDILIGPAQFRQFVRLCHQRALEAFGGGWFHYCGGAKGYGRCEGVHLHELYAEVDGLRGLNWSTAGDWIAEMRKLQALGVVHVGGAPREDGEALEDYFRRVLSVYERRAGIVFMADVKADEKDGAMDLWHLVQDDLFA